MSVEKVQFGLGGDDSRRIADEINKACAGGKKIIGCVVETPSYSNWPRPYLLVTNDPAQYQGEGI